MEKRAGSIAGLLAMIALVFHTANQSGSEHSNGGGPPEQKAAGSASHKEKAEDANAKPHSKGPWLATQQYLDYLPPEAETKGCAEYLASARPEGLEQSSCNSFALPALFGFPKNYDFQTNISGVIATIQDPLHTRMSLETDRTLDSIQQAAFHAGWEFATQWLPWNVRESNPGNDSSAEQSSEYEVSRETLPGLIVFRPHFTLERSPEKVLLVFVVGETPTAGINGFQFEFARRCLIALQKQPKTISVLGPNFSGSFASLTKLIENDPDKSRRYEIRSGSVSNLEYADSMLHILKQANFHGYSMPSPEMGDLFAYLVRNVWRYTDEQAAELVEDESGFGFIDPKRPRRFQVYRYSRDIAQLRNAYRDIAFAKGNTAETVTTPALDFSLKDSQAGEDNFPIFSQAHTPISQNVVLEQIVHELSRKKIRVVRLDATNVFDTLFLARVLKKYCPDIRVVVGSADLLYVEQTSDVPLTGLVAISTYPMFAAGRSWANPASRETTTFPDSDSIGEYNACMSLLAGDPKESINNGGPGGGKTSQGTGAWILALGQNGWWPVEFVDHSNPTFRSGAGTWFEAPSTNTNGFEVPRQPGLWKLLCILVALFNLGICARIVYLRHHPKVLVWSSLCPGEFPWRYKKRSADGLVALKSPLRIRDGVCMCLLACFVSTMFVAGVELIPVLAVRFVQNSLRADTWAEALVAGLLVDAFLLPLIGCIYLISWFVARPFEECAGVPASSGECNQQLSDSEGLSYRVRLISIAIAIFLTPIIALGCWAACCFSGPRGLLLCFRAESLSLGISPVWPLLLCGAALFCAAFFNLRRFAWAGNQSPILSLAVIDDALGGQFKRLMCTLNRHLLSPAAYDSKLVGTATLGTAGLGAIAIMLLAPREDLRSLEPVYFEYALMALLGVLITMTGFAFLQFAACWATVRAFLSALNSLVIGHYFTRVADFAGSTPVWFRQVPLLSLTTSANSAIALHNLQLSAPATPKYNEKYWGALRAFVDPQTVKPSFLPAAGATNVPKTQKDRSQFVHDYFLFHQVTAEISDDLAKRIVEPYWTQNILPSIESDTKTADDVKSEKPEDSAYRYAMKFVVLQYAAFIGYVLRQLQNLLLCSVLGFVLVVLVLNSYAFQAPQTITRFLILGLVAAGVIVVRALAQMEKDPILSRLSGTAEGELGKDFYIRAIGYGALPVLTVVSSQFPAVSQFLMSWAAPTLEALK